jgi:hypothetical protein
MTTASLCLSSFARDLQGRVGLGYNAQFAPSKVNNDYKPAIALKYAFTKDMAIEGVAGLSTGDNKSSVAGIKLFKNLFFETNLNFYFVGGLALGSVTTAGVSTSGIELQGGFGSEFFIPGLESIGISLETGFDFNNISGSWSIGTMGASFLHAGMRFYF